MSIRVGLRLQSVLLVVIAALLPASAHAQNFTDKFDLKPFWTVTEQSGTATLASDVSVSGSHALKLSSKPGNQRDIWLTHVFAAPLKGTLSVWFYDTGAGTQTLYAGLYARDSTNPFNDFAVNVADWNATHYVWHGPGMSETSTGVGRTNGWHEFTLRVTATKVEALIDGVAVGTVSGDYTFDIVRLLLSGPASQPDATFYFDDFKFRKVK